MNSLLLPSSSSDDDDSDDDFLDMLLLAQVMNTNNLLMMHSLRHRRHRTEAISGTLSQLLLNNLMGHRTVLGQTHDNYRTTVSPIDPIPTSTNHHHRRRSSNSSNRPLSSSMTTTTTMTAPGADGVVEKYNNPLLEKQSQFLDSLPENLVQKFFSNRHTDPTVRAETWSRQAELGETLVNQYSWATPDKRCMKILQYFGNQHGIVEIGCGSNAYWARMMNQQGMDVMAFDALLGMGGKITNIEKSGNSNPKKKRKRDDDMQNRKTFSDGFVVYRGGPEVLTREDLQKRVLFLCYPDEDVMEEQGAECESKIVDDDDDDEVVEEEEEEKDDDDDDDDDDDGKEESMGAACLKYFKGDTIIHVGEIFGDTPSMDQAPWGRSSGPVFQQRLASEFHCILKVKMKNWLHVNDTMTVWKRSELCSIVFQGEDDDESNEEVEYRHIPVEERLPVDIAAPCVKHLLDDEDN